MIEKQLEELKSKFLSCGFKEKKIPEDYFHLVFESFFTINVFWKRNNNFLQAEFHCKEEDLVMFCLSDDPFQEFVQSLKELPREIQMGFESSIRDEILKHEH